MKINSKFLVYVRCFTYNQAPYIEDALNGFAMQQTDFPFVCVIMDDCSTDGEQEVIAHYMKQHFNIDDDTIVRREETDDYRMLFAQHKANHNCFFAVYYLKYNHGSIKKSKLGYFVEWGDVDYISLCEGDDYWINPLKLQKQVSFLVQNPDYGLVHSNYYSRYKDKIIKNHIAGLVEFDDLVTKSGIGTLTTCYRKKLADEYYIAVPVEKREGWLLSDAPLWIFIAHKSKIHYFNESFSVYRELPESASHSTDVDKAVRIIDNSYEVRKYMLLKLTQPGKKQESLLKDLFNNRNVLSKVRLCSHRGYAKRAFEIYKHNWKHLTFKTNILCIIYMLYGVLKPSKV